MKAKCFACIDCPSFTRTYQCRHKDPTFIMANLKGRLVQVLHVDSNTGFSDCARSTEYVNTMCLLVFLHYNSCDHQVLQNVSPCESMLSSGRLQGPAADLTQQSSYSFTAEEFQIVSECGNRQDMLLKVLTCTQCTSG